METVIFNAVLIVCAIAAVGLTIYSVMKIARLNARFESAIVLIPLYKKSKLPLAFIIIFVILLIGDLIWLSFSKNLIPPIMISVILASGIVLFITMMKSRCAVLDSGVVVPFRFIDWTHLYDFKVENGEIFFCGDENGNDTLNGVTPKMTFDAANMEKLNYILNSRKINK